jgi:hypothetical protein
MSIHDARDAIGGFALGKGARQQQQGFDEFVYSAAASRDVMKNLDTVIE